MSMKWEKGGYKSNYARVKGLGAAHDGVNHWVMQRLTAISNFVLVIWAVFSIVNLVGADYGTFRGWLAEPINAILMILFIISTFYHAVLGMQVITEDYIHHKGFKIAKLVSQKLVYFALGVACIFSILKVAFTI